MVDWNSPLEVTREYEALKKAAFVLVGIYVWEFIISLDFDFQFITRQKPFRWPMIFYFLNRYLRLLSIIGLILEYNLTLTNGASECQWLYIINSLTASAAIALSSMILSLRTMAVWGMERYIVAPVTVIILGHWALLMSGPSLQAGSCTAAYLKPLMVAVWIYTMVFDFIVMALMAAKLLKTFSERSRLADLVFRDGLIYFIIAFLTNLIGVTFMLLDLNAVMFGFANFPAGTIQSIVACRVVRRLHNFSASGTEMLSTIGPVQVFRPGKPPYVDQGCSGSTNAAIGPKSLKSLS